MAVAADAAQARSAIYVKLGILYTEKVQNVAAGDRRLAGAAAAGAGEPARAGRAQEAVSAAARTGTRSRSFYAAQGKWDELVRVLERQAESEDDAGARRPVEQDRRALSRSPAARRIARRRPTRRRCRSTARTSRRAAGADPALREGQGRQAPGRGAVRRAGTHDAIAAERPGAPAAARRAARLRRRRQGGRAARSRCTAFAEIADRRVGASRRRAAWPRESRRLGASWSQAYEAALPRACRATTRGAAGAAVDAGRAPTSRELANPEAAIERNQTILELAPKNPRRSARSSGCTSPPGASRDLLAVYDKKLELAKTQGRGARRSASSWPASTKTRSSSPTRRSQLYQAILKQDAEQVPALAALDRIYTSSSAAGRSWRRRIDAEIDLAHRHGARSPS